MHKKPKRNKKIECNFCEGFGVVIEKEVYPGDKEENRICDICNGAGEISKTLHQIVQKGLGD